ncbi:MAG TPA: glycoside hydrolase family 15 protein [Syntrophales bacterium]|nr:glycoside hydrolase family 15 protein [Syntrophales bacterium]
MSPENSYLPISDYGVIGNMRTAALVGSDGSIDWCSFPNLDSPSVFAAILDRRKGGRFRVWLPESDSTRQYYRGDTNILCTEFKGRSGKVTITDFMPVSGRIHGCGQSEAAPELHRILRCDGGDPEIMFEWRPRFDYAGAETRIGIFQGGWIASGPGNALILGGSGGADLEADGFGPVLRGRIRMRAGEKQVLVTSWGLSSVKISPEESEAAMERTAGLWQEWAHQEGISHCDEWAGEFYPHLIRSELVLKLMINADTGAMAAAPTTSLPETIGGVRNWDYRYAWIRDSFQAAQALVSLGHKREAVELLDWMERVAGGSGRDRAPQIMYSLHGGTDLTEKELEHLEGYRCSRPVRIGNGAAEQLQLEIYGELMDTAYELALLGNVPEPGMMDFLARIADTACRRWKEPDHGIWEVRTEPRHFTYSKIMVWVALDRAVRLARKFGMKGNVKNWIRSRDEIRRAVLERGFDRNLGSFVMSFGSGDMDSANLRIPLMGFLPAGDPMVQGTIDMTLKRLTRNGFVFRYDGDDGLPGKEGAFGLCTFWMADALALSGRTHEARNILEGVLGRCNSLGLLPEQFDAVSGEYLGNYPQAFSHIGLINSIIYLSRAEGRPVPEKMER